MPCQSDYPREEEHRLSGELDRVTQVACELAKELRRVFENEGYSWEALISKKTRKWVEKHDEADRKRIRREALEKKRKHLKKTALNKLTKEEREVLGLH